MSNWPQYGLKAQWRAPVEEKAEKKSQVAIEKLVPNEAYRMEFT
jgi:hypothetical protein